MRQLFILYLFMIWSISAIGQTPRLLITTDIGGDPDDQQALVRLMVYTNEFDIEGFVCSASGTPGELKEAVVRPDLVNEIVSAYGKVYPNLVKHDSNYPMSDRLLTLVKKGNPNRGWNNVGEGNDTEGSDWIIDVVDKPDERPINICIFGGQTDLAQALWKVKESRTEDEYHKFIAGIRVYDIMDQDRIFKNLLAEHPTLFYILSRAPEGIDKREGIYRGMYLGGDESLTSLEWLQENVIEGHGPLGELYPTKTWTAPNPYGALKEGDTPSWFFFLNNGLNCPEYPEYGGWGGRYQKNDQGYFSDAVDTFQGEKNARATVYRWRDDFQRDFAARMDWCVKAPNECNHAPLVIVNGTSENEVLKVKAKANKRVKFDAGKSSDPDGDSLEFEWFFYPETGGFMDVPAIKTKGKRAEFIMPQLSGAKALHLILKVTDSGDPKLTSYKRIIVDNPKNN